MYQVARVALAAALALGPAARPAAGQQGAPALSGLWGAKVRFGPDVRGSLLLLREGKAWRADIAGYSPPVRSKAGALSFELPGGQGSFRGRMSGREIAGHWIGPASQTSGMRYATPLVLEADGPDRWRGEVKSLDDAFSFYLPLTRQRDGGYATYLRNPERNLGRFIRVSRVEVKDDVVTLLSEQRGRGAEGRYDDGVIRLPLNGASFDFTRADSENSSAFYPRGKSG
ncbi:MAG: 6-aminohexanoate hydrolase, partial [Gemmatimonadales bacterium]